MNQICNKEELIIFLFKFDGFLNWTIQANGKYEFKEVEGIFLQLLIEYLGIPIKFIHSNEEAKKYLSNGRLDMAVGKFKTAIDPTGNTEGSTPHRMNYVTFAVGKSVPLSTRFAFLYPFTLQTWLGFFVVCILFPVIVIFLMKRKISYLDLCLQMLCCLLRQAYQVSVKSTKIRLLFLFWLFFTMVVSFSHSAVFFSFMVNPLKNPPVRNFEELSSIVAAGNRKCYIQYYSYVLDSIRE